MNENHSQATAELGPGNPDEILARKITLRLVAEGLLSEDEAAKLLARLSAGRMSQDDWRMAFENSMEKRPS